MDDSRWERIAALGGIVFVVLGAVGGFLPGAPPDADAPKEEIFQFVKDNDSALQIGQILTGLGVIGLAWWFGSLFRRMRAAEGGNPRLSVVALLGLSLSGSFALLSEAITSAVAMRFNNLGPDFTRALFTLSYVVIATSAFGVIVFLSAVCALNFRARMFPMWTSYLGWLAAAGFAVGSIGSGSENNAFVGVGFMSFLVWCIWILAISVLMWREPASAT